MKLFLTISLITLLLGFITLNASAQLYGPTNSGGSNNTSPTQNTNSVSPSQTTNNSSLPQTGGGDPMPFVAISLMLVSGAGLFVVGRLIRGN
jgi:LPXTG-motif cell wall-anchored protein